MKVLLHVEPLIETQRPFWKTGWATFFSQYIIDSLISAQTPDLQIKIVLNEPISLKFKHNSVENLIFDQRDLFEAFGSSDPWLASMAWQKETYTEGQISNMANLYKQKLNGFQPDIIICFSAVPYLAKLFPDALILYHEYSIFSRRPYPHTWYFDPCGLYDKSFLNRFADEIKKTQLTQKDIDILYNFKRTCREILSNASPYRPLVEDARSRFRALALLPLQFSGYPAFDAFVEYRSQYDFLIDILEKTPGDVGLIVTTHPEYNILTSETIEYLNYKYPNFIYSNDFEKYYAPSQYLLPEVDTVIAVSSSVGLQSLMFNKPLVNPGGAWQCISPHYDVRQISATTDSADHSERDAFLFWVLTRYATLKSRIDDGEWLRAFFERGIHIKRSCGIGADFFEPFAATETIFADLLQRLDTNLPEISPNYSHERALSLLREKNAENLSLTDEIQTLTTAVHERDALLGPLSETATKAVDLLKLLENEDASPAVLCAAGHICLALQATDTARTFFLKAIRIDPDFAEATEGLCALHMRVKQDTIL